MLVPCWFTVFVSGLDIQPQNVKPVFGCFCFVLRWWTSGKITSERLFIAKCCHQEWAAHACSRFAHALLTLCSRSPRFLLSPLGSLWVLTRFLLGPYEGLLTVCSRFAHGLLALLTLCSRFGGLCVYFDEETHKQTMPLFCCSEPCVPKAHSFQAADSLRLIFKSDKTTPTCHSQPFAEAGLPHPCLSLRYVCATFLLSPKDSESISYIYYGIMTCSFVAQRAQKVHL